VYSKVTQLCDTRCVIQHLINIVLMTEATYTPLPLLGPLKQYVFGN